MVIAVFAGGSGNFPAVSKLMTNMRHCNGALGFIQVKTFREPCLGSFSTLDRFRQVGEKILVISSPTQRFHPFEENFSYDRPERATD